MWCSVCFVFIGFISIGNHVIRWCVLAILQTVLFVFTYKTKFTAKVIWLIFYSPLPIRNDIHTNFCFWLGFVTFRWTLVMLFFSSLQRYNDEILCVDWYWLTFEKKNEWKKQTKKRINYKKGLQSIKLMKNSIFLWIVRYKWKEDSCESWKFF